MTPSMIPLLLAPLATALPHAWTDPSESTIEWRSCPEVNELVTASNGVQGASFDCATLSVPRDYQDLAGDKLDLSLFRVNATKEPILGSVLFNPGGPGGTGAENLPLQGPDIVEILGGQYNVVSWDPRGTGKTLPFDCNYTQFLSSISNSNEEPQLATSGSKRDEEPHLARTDTTAYFLAEGWDASAAYAEACYKKMNETGSLIGTAYTARDMLEIVDALGEGGKLRYWGLSYGTALGNYFASMFPDRIERMMLDGNMNPHSYARGDYGPYPGDADKTFNAFLEQCIENAANCSLATYTNAKTPADIINAINTNPNISLTETAVAASSNTLAYFTLAGSKSYVHSGLYFANGWPKLADDIALFMAGQVPPSLQPPNNTDGDAPPKYNAGAPNALDGIRCSDALWSGVTDPLEIVDTVTYSATTSEDFGDTGFGFSWASAAWKMPAKERANAGTFFNNIKTSFPILFVNGLFDPATPAAFATNASAGYEGSKVLFHKGYGHGLMSNPSECVKGYVRRYFMEGTLPEKSGLEGKVCEPDLMPWQQAAAVKEAAAATVGGGGGS